MRLMRSQSFKQKYARGRMQVLLLQCMLHEVRESASIGRCTTVSANCSAE